MIVNSVSVESVAMALNAATDSTDTELTIIGEYTPGACTPVVT
ncbi:hypothetical protein AADL45_25390, partial [Escherichia coli]